LKLARFLPDKKVELASHVPAHRQGKFIAPPHQPPPAILKEKNKKGGKTFFDR